MLKWWLVVYFKLAASCSLALHSNIMTALQNFTLLTGNVDA